MLDQRHPQDPRQRPGGDGRNGAPSAQSPSVLHGESGRPGSGRSTPVQAGAAPPVPSMAVATATPLTPVPTSTHTQSSKQVVGQRLSRTEERSVTGNALGINSLRALRIKKENMAKTGPVEELSKAISQLHEKKGPALITHLASTISLALDSIVSEQKYNPDEATVKAEVDLMRSENAALRRELTNLRNMVENQAPSTVDEERLQSVESRLSAVDSVKDELKGMQDNVQALTTDMNSVNKRLYGDREDGTLAKVRQLDDEMANIFDKNRSLVKKGDEYERKMSEMANKINASEVKMDKVERQSAANQRELSELKPNFTKLEADVSAMKATPNVKEHELKTVQAKQKAHEHTLAKMHDKLTKVEAATSETQKSLDHRGSEIEKATSTNRECQERLTKLEDDFKETVKTLDTLSKSQQKGQDELQSRAKQLEEANMKSQETLRLSEKSTQKTLSSLEARITEIGNSSLATRERTGTPQLSLSAMANLAAVDKKLEEINKEVDILKTSKGEWEHFKAELIAIREAEKLLRTDFETMKYQAIDFFAEELGKEEKNRRADTDALKSNIDAMHGKIHSLENDMRTLNPSNGAAEFDSNIRAIDGRVSLLQDRLRTLETSNGHLHTGLQNLGNEHAILVETTNAHHMAIKSLEDRYTNISTESLHKKMIHHFQNTYPSAPDFLAKLNMLYKLYHQLRTDFDTLTHDLPDNRQGAIESVRQSFLSLAEDVDRVRIKAEKDMENLKNHLETVETKVDHSSSQVTRHGDLIENCYNRLDTDKSLSDERLRPLEESGRKIPSLEEDITRLKEDLSMCRKLVATLAAKFEGISDLITEIPNGARGVGSIPEQNRARPR